MMKSIHKMRPKNMDTTNVITIELVNLLWWTLVKTWCINYFIQKWRVFFLKAISLCYSTCNYLHFPLVSECDINSVILSFKTKFLMNNSVIKGLVNYWGWKCPINTSYSVPIVLYDVCFKSCRVVFNRMILYDNVFV